MILNAATEELDHLPSADDFTLDSLARRLGLSRGTIYLYFKNRDAIFAEILIDTVNKFLSEMARSFSLLPTPTTSRKMARAYCDVLKKDRELRHLPSLLKSLSKSSDKKAKRLEEEIESCRHLADVTMTRKLKGLQSGDGRLIMHFGWSLLLGFSEFMNSPTKTGISPDVLQQVEDGLTLIIDGLLARVK